jgi:hypothetical protein
VPQQVAVLVVARHQHIDRGPGVLVLGQCDRCPLDRHDVDEGAEHIDEHALKLGQIKQQAGKETGAVDRGDGVERPPREIPHRNKDDDQHQQDAKRALWFGDMQNGQSGQGDRAEQILTLQADILGGEQGQGGSPDDPGGGDQEGARVRSAARRRSGCNGIQGLYSGRKDVWERAGPAPVRGSIADRRRA